jgi:hypothetical protein
MCNECILRHRVRANNWPLRVAVAKIERADASKEIVIYPIPFWWKVYWRVLCTP